MFVTCFYAILDPVEGRLRYANAGHNLPYLWHEGQSSSDLWARGMPLGLMPRMRSIFGSEELPALTRHTITKLSELEEHLRAVRERGYALDKGEVDEDLHCVAAPVRDTTGCVIAGVSIAGPSNRFSEYLPTYTAIILDAALDISQRLGYQIGESRSPLPGEEASEEADARRRVVGARVRSDESE